MERLLDRQDTYKGNPWQPWTQNLYVYVSNNPVNFIDPTGHANVAAGDGGDASDEPCYYEPYCHYTQNDSGQFNLPAIWALCELATDNDCANFLDANALILSMPEVNWSLDMADAGLSALGKSARAGALAEGDWAVLSGMLREASLGKGMFGIGEASVEEAGVLGRAWVGKNASWSSDGTALVSQDGLRQYRPPTWKPKQGMVQANLEWRNIPKGKFGNNAHINVTYGPPYLP